MPWGHGFIESVPIRSLLAEFHDQPSDLKIGADHCVILSGIALPAGQQALQFFSELPQLLDLTIDPLDLAPQLDSDVVTGQDAGVVHGQAALDLLQTESEGLEPADEPQALQAQVLVLAQGLDRQATAAGQGPDLHVGRCHGLDSPPVGRL